MMSSSKQVSTFRITGILIALFIACDVGAQALNKPKGPVLLTVNGNIGLHNVGNTVQFDAEMLDALPKTSIVTSSPEYVGAQTFSGPLLKSVLEAVKAQGKTLSLKAQDNYEVDVPVSDATTNGLLIARRINGNELKIRTRGPLLMMYPFDKNQNLRNNVYYGRAVWQLIAIVVK